MSRKSLISGQLRLILGITAVHAVAWFTYYGQIPAGLCPSQEASATLEAARAIAAGSPTAESGYSLYTYILSLLARFFTDNASLTSAARGLNALALLIAVGLCASAAGNYWRRNSAVWISGLLVGLNPVLIFWAGEVSPSLLATACISVALWRILRWLRNPGTKDNVWIGVSLSLATAFETTLLPLALIWPAFAYFISKRKRIKYLTLALIPPAVTCGLILVSSLQLQDTLQWNTDQFAINIYQALGNQESYDAKSFSLYRQLHLLLFLNPIHWGALFIVAGLGAYARLKEGHNGKAVLLAVGILTIFAVSFAVNHSGSQARASLIPLLALFAAGMAFIPKIWRRASQRTRRKIMLGTLCMALFSYAGHFIFPQSQLWEHDYSYLAEANIELGNNERAVTWAEKALELNPDSIRIKEVLVIAQFNDWAISNQPRSLPIEIAKEFLVSSRGVKETPTARVIQAIYLYKLREIEKAYAIWESQRESSALAVACLYWTGGMPELSRSDINAYTDHLYYPLLVDAIGVDRNARKYRSVKQTLDNMLAFAY